MHAQDLLAALHVRQPHHHLAVEAARTQQRRVQHVGTVGGRDHDDAFAALETVHLHQQLVQGLLALVVAAAQAGTAMAADSVDLVDEDDAGGMLLGLFEHVAHAAGAHAHEHLDEVRTGDAEERHLGLAGDGLGQQRLAGTGLADHQHAARDLAAQLLELAGVAQELDQFADFLLGFIATGDVGEGDLHLVLALQLGARLAEGHGALGATAAALHLPHDEDPETDDQQHRQEVQQDGHQRDAAFRLLAVDGDVLVQQRVDQLVVLRAINGAGGAVLALEGDGVGGQVALVGELHRGHAAGLDLAQEFGIRDRATGRSGTALGREALEDHHQHDGDDYPQQQILGQVVHPHRLRRSSFVIRTLRHLT